MIEAVLFDLDDTLFPQETWLDGAWETVACAATTDARQRARLLGALRRVCSEGSARGGIIDRGLAEAGMVDVAVAPLVDAFRNYRAPDLTPYAGACELVAELRECVSVGLITDGDPGIQQGKLDSLGLADAFDVIVFSDVLGRDQRKPHPQPFLTAARQLAVTPERAVFVGDRPDKDVDGAAGAGMRAVRVLTGEYRDMPNGRRPWRTVATVADARDLLMAATSPGRRRPPIPA